MKEPNSVKIYSWQSSPVAFPSHFLLSRHTEKPNYPESCAIGLESPDFSPASDISEEMMSAITGLALNIPARLGTLFSSAQLGIPSAGEGGLTLW